MTRPIRVTLHRKMRGKLQALWTRSYSRLDRALPRLTQLAYIEGANGDVFEVFHAQTGLQIGTVRVGLKSIHSEWLWGKD